MWITSSFDSLLVPTCVALGNFDGVHRGHRRVIDPVVDAAERARAYLQPGAEGSPSSVHSTVVTFYPHPQEYFSGQKRALLTPLDEKIDYLQSIGVEQLMLIPFNDQIATLSPEEFVQHILVDRLQATLVSVGQDFCFGRNRSGTVEDLRAIVSGYGIAVQVATLHQSQGERISSSAIRLALQEGDLERANDLLGRPYTLVGKVVYGQQLGRTIGFPTANLQVPPEKCLPRQGVYSVRVHCSALKLEERRLAGVMNIGCRPTVDGLKQTIEVHILDWSGDLYGQTLIVSLEAFLRPEQKFSSLEALQAQIQADVEAARSLSPLA